MKADDAAIAAAQLNLDYCTITAPFDGRVGLRQIDAGNFVRASRRVAGAASSPSPRSARSR